MKKLLGIMVSVAIVISLGACGAKEENNTQNQTVNSNEETKQSGMATEKTGKHK